MFCLQASQYFPYGPKLGITAAVIVISKSPFIILNKVGKFCEIWGPNQITSLMAEFLHLADALMEHFLEGIDPLRYWHINPNEKSDKYKSSLLS